MKSKYVGLDKEVVNNPPFSQLEKVGPRIGRLWSSLYKKLSRKQRFLFLKRVFDLKCHVSIIPDMVCHLFSVKENTPKGLVGLAVGNLVDRSSYCLCRVKSNRPNLRGKKQANDGQ